jgi:biopolymer transport protein ExbB
LDSSQFHLLSLFSDGGLMMYPLVMCSLIALGVMIAKVYTLVVADRNTRKVLSEVEAFAEEGKITEAIKVAVARPGPAAAILVVGLRRISHGDEGKELSDAIKTTGTIELGFLERGLVILATIANVAPLMGFLGTVVGMIIAFASIEAAGDVDPTLVAGGIKVALLTTATGLLIAIPVNIGYNFFVTKIDHLIMQMEIGAQKVLDIAYTYGSATK